MNAFSSCNTYPFADDSYFLLFIEFTVFLESEIRHWMPRARARAEKTAFALTGVDFAEDFDSCAPKPTPDVHGCRVPEIHEEFLPDVTSPLSSMQNAVVPASNASTCVPPWYIENI